MIVFGNDSTEKKRNVFNLMVYFAQDKIPFWLNLPENGTENHIDHNNIIIFCGLICYNQHVKEQRLILNFMILIWELSA